MRLLLRLSVLGTLVVIFLILLAICTSRRSTITLEQKETDEAIKLLLATGDDAQASAGLQQVAPVVSSSSNGHPIVRPVTAQLTFNVAVVLVVSLLSVALLITGIVIVAVTLNPDDSTSNYHHNYLTVQSSCDSDNEQLIGPNRKSILDQEFDSGGEYNDGDLCVDSQEKRGGSYKWDPEAQVWSPTHMRLP